MENTNYDMYERVNYSSSVQFSHVRGYASIINYSLENNRSHITKHNYNLLEPLTYPYGNHLPLDTANNSDKNPQMTLAWKK